MYMPYTIRAGQLSYISSYQTLSEDKIWKSYKTSKKLIKKMGAYPLHP